MHAALVVVVGLIGLIQADPGKESVQIIDHPDKNEYTSFIAGTDKHKYGYELKENRHFHHTTTEEDGVRLGCYGYVLYGKKYSTQYVADSRGYRPVITHDSITVYPKSGGERQASFVGDFNEDEQRSKNIRYFFPDGCKGSDIKIQPFVVPMPQPSVRIKTDSGINPPGTPKISRVLLPDSGLQPPFERPIESQVVNLESPTKKANSTSPPSSQAPVVTLPPTTIKPFATTTPTTPLTITSLPTTSLKPVIKTTSSNPQPILSSPTTTSKPATSLPATTLNEITLTSKKANEIVNVTAATSKPTAAPILTTIPLMSENLLRANVLKTGKADTCGKSCCSDDESIAKLILPIPIKSMATSSGSCGAFAKLVLPLEGLSPEDLKSLAKSDSDSKEIIKNILKSLF